DAWTGRDPRFYHDIVYDGVRMNQGATSTREAPRFANLNTGGSYRDENAGSRTGYVLGKFIPRTTNYEDFGHDNDHFIHISFMRLADIYLIYAEAVANGYGSPNATSPDWPGGRTAVQAINTVRARAVVRVVHSKFLTYTE